MCSFNCSDGRDNDNDGLVDSRDPGCVDNWDDELSREYACDDGVDNDGNGLTDLKDTRCLFPDDDDELIKKISEKNGNFHNSVLVNIDNDAALEIAVLDSPILLSQNIVYFDDNGAVLKELSPEPNASLYGDLLASDLDGDGKDELIIVTKNAESTVYIVYANGTSFKF
jgi:hypothetical protein